MISSIINQKPFPKWNINPQWSQINRLSEELKVQNLLYYGIIGQDIKGAWKKEVEDSYKKAILSDEKYPSVVRGVLDALEKKHIHSMLISGFDFRKYYPKTQMRALNHVSILIEKGKEKQAETALKLLGFVFVSENEKKEKIFYKLNGNINLKLCVKMDFLSRRLKKYFVKPVTIYKIKRDKVCIHEMTPEETYIYLISQIAEDFVLKNLNMQKLIDLYCFYKMEEKLLDKISVKKEIESLKLTKFNDYIMQLLEYWFGKSFFPTENNEYKALERYILTKGNQGVNFAQNIISLTIKEEKNKDLTKEKSQLTEWLFPDLEYMKGLYPSLEKKPHLLRVYRLTRFFRIIGKRIKLAFTSVKNYIKRAIKLTIRSIKNIGYKISDKFNKNEDNNT